MISIMILFRDQGAHSTTSRTAQHACTKFVFRSNRTLYKFDSYDINVSAHHSKVKQGLIGLAL
jgi:hypothetical protein